MKLLHTSDWHLGMMQRGSISYIEDQRYFIDRICEIATKEKVDGIIIAGDIFDKGIASQDALKLYDEKMTYICATLNIPVYIIAGNHDGAERLSQCNELLRKSGLYISGSLSSEPYVVNCGDVDIYLLPWISTDKVKSIYVSDADKVASMEDAYKVVLDKYRDKFVEGHKNVLVSHAFITNAETSVSDRAAEVGKAAMVGSYVFEGFDYVALGHLHGPQKIDDHIRYSGSPMAYSFGKEEKQEKGIVIYDTDTCECKVVSIPNLHDRISISGTYDELISADVPDRMQDAYVKITVTDSYVGLETVAAFKEKYANLLEISGKGFDNPDETISMTIEEFEDVSNDPETIFTKYCEDVLKEAPSEHLLSLFRDAISEAGKGESL